MVIVTLLKINISHCKHMHSKWDLEAFVNSKMIGENQGREVSLEQGKLFFELKAIEHNGTSTEIAIHKEIVDYHRIVNDSGAPIKKEFKIEVENRTITFHFKMKEVIKVSQG